MKPSSILSGDFSEERWVDQISKNFDDEVGSDTNNVSVCVFSVPKSISHYKPEAYVPLAIALGPYHHFETHFYQMERYKVAAVKSILSQDQVLRFESLVINTLKERETMIRACYHMYMNLDQDTLAWIVAVDGLFLLCLLGHFADIAPLMPKKLINDGILYRDVMVLENQIPLCLLSEIWKTLRLSSNSHDHNCNYELFFTLRKFCELHSPLKLAKDYNYGIEMHNLHLLDLMYHLIVKNQDTQQSSLVKMVKEDNSRENIGVEIEMEMRLSLGARKNTDHPIKVKKNKPWEKISNLLDKKIMRRDKENNDDPPRVRENEIPSVSSLSKYGGININQTNGGIRDVNFDKNEATLYLPVITLDAYSEVVLRNLIAYELATSSSTPELAEYIDLMSGIIDAESDVKLLRNKGIIKGNMNDKEITDMFNGMYQTNAYLSSSKTIEQLHKYYNNRPMIKAWRFIKKDIIVSQKVATVVLTVSIFFLMILYSFCEVYGCRKIFDRK